MMNTVRKKAMKKSILIIALVFIMASLGGCTKYNLFIAAKNLTKSTTNLNDSDHKVYRLIDDFDKGEIDTQKFLNRFKKPYIKFTNSSIRASHNGLLIVMRRKQITGEGAAEFVAPVYVMIDNTLSVVALLVSKGDLEIKYGGTTFDDSNAESLTFDAIIDGTFSGEFGKKSKFLQDVIQRLSFQQDQWVKIIENSDDYSGKVLLRRNQIDFGDGFVKGIWHGFRWPVVFVMSIFAVAQPYSVTNTGLTYLFGFLFGLFLLLVVLGMLSGNSENNQEQKSEE